MHRSGNDFTYIHNVKRGRHAYKFVVDDEWRFAPDQVTLLCLQITKLKAWYACFLFNFLIINFFSIDSHQPQVADIEGRINNFIDVSEFHPYIGDNSFFEKSKGKTRV